jgi:hypothetical protein
LRSEEPLSARRDFYPFALAAFALAAETSVLTLAVVLGRVPNLMGLNVLVGFLYFAAPIIWVAIFAWARRRTGRKANWLFLGLPFALEPWLLVGVAFVLLWYGCTYGTCDL